MAPSSLPLFPLVTGHSSGNVVSGEVPKSSCLCVLAAWVLYTPELSVSPNPRLAGQDGQWPRLVLRGDEGRDEAGRAGLHLECC